MTCVVELRCTCPCDGVGCGRLAGLSSEEDFNQSPKASWAAQWCRHDGIAPNPALDWRILRQGSDPMIDRAFIARLWTSFRSAVHEFKISRMQRRSDSRFRVVEVRKCDRRRHSSSGCRPHLSTRCNQLKRAVRRRGGVAAAAVSYPKPTTIENAGWGFKVGGEEDETEEESVTEESAPFSWTRWKEIDIKELSPRPNPIGVAAFSSSRSMEEFGSLKWDDNFLTTNASTRSALQLGESASASTSYFDHRRWENRVSNKSPQLIQPVRGKLTTLSSLLRTMSDRYARRTGKLTPLHDRSNNKRPVLTQLLSAAPWLTQPQHHRSNSAFRIVDDVPVKRYENPFQDFLRQSFAERNSRSVHGLDCQR